MGEGFGPAFHRLPVFEPNGSNGMVEFFEPYEILFVFRGSAVHRGLIQAPWALRNRFHPFHLYARTQSGLRRVNVRTIAGARAALPDCFVLCDRGVVVNRPAIRWREARVKNHKWVGFRVPVGEASLVDREWVRVNPRRVRDVLGPFDWSPPRSGGRDAISGGRDPRNQCRCACQRVASHGMRGK